MSRAEIIVSNRRGSNPDYDWRSMTREERDLSSNKRGSNYGSKVSMLKDIFQGNAKPAPTVNVNVNGNIRSGISRQTSSESPENKNRENLDNSARLASRHSPTRQSPPRVSPPRATPPRDEISKLIDTSTHVERFNNTRALFARLEEENIKNNRYGLTVAGSTKQRSLSSTTASEQNGLAKSRAQSETDVHRRWGARNQWRRTSESDQKPSRPSRLENRARSEIQLESRVPEQHEYQRSRQSDYADRKSGSLDSLLQEDEGEMGPRWRMSRAMDDDRAASTEALEAGDAHSPSDTGETPHKWRLERGSRSSDSERDSPVRTNESPQSTPRRDFSNNSSDLHVSSNSTPGGDSSSYYTPNETIIPQISHTNAQSPLATRLDSPISTKSSPLATSSVSPSNDIPLFAKNDSPMPYSPTSSVTSPFAMDRLPLARRPRNHDYVNVVPIEQMRSADSSPTTPDSDDRRSWAKNLIRYSPKKNGEEETPPSILDGLSPTEIISQTSNSSLHLQGSPPAATSPSIGDVRIIRRGPSSEVDGAGDADHDVLLSPGDDYVTAADDTTKLKKISNRFKPDVSPTEDHLVPLRPTGAAVVSLVKREDGDGHEQPDLGYHTDTHTLEITEDGIHILEDGNFFYEVAGLPLHPEDVDTPIPFHQTKVKFSTHPIQVFSTHSVDEYDRRNDDIDPVAASAEYELEKRVERMDIFPVEILKGVDGLGLSIIGMGVGADAGVEKLGIFVKTLTSCGAAERDGRIMINDQILEVDGKSLVGVTQAYAASVLRNTNGMVRFSIGREKNPEKSEVARLIQQSLDQDQKRVEVQRREVERQQYIERELQREEEEHQEKQLRHDEMLAQQEGEKHKLEELPALLESPGLDEDDLSPELPPSNIEVFELDESESETATPDMEPQALFIKFKEAQYKNAVAEAEVTKLKAKMIRLENIEIQKRALEKKCEDTSKRLRDLENKLHQSQEEISSYQDLMEGSQGQYIALEKQMQHQHGALEKKYQKAKKMIKEYQVRERDLIREREAFLQQQVERDQHYNDIVRKLKDRIIDMESQLRDAQTAAGMPVTEMPPTLVSSPLPQRAQMPMVECLAADNLSEVSSESEDMSPEVEVEAKHAANVFQEMPSTELLDNTPGKSRAALVKDTRSGLAGRRPPSKRLSIDEDTEKISEEDVEHFLRHDSNDTHSDTSSVSQTSYEPSHPLFAGMASEIPEMTETSSGGGDIQLLSSRLLDKSLGSPRGINLSRPTMSSTSLLGRSPTSPDSGGITLISSKPINTGYSNSQPTEVNVDTGMVMEYDDDHGKSSSYSLSDATLTDADQNSSKVKSNQWQSCAISEWSCDQVIQWLICLELDLYKEAFLNDAIDGAKLLQLDTTKFKSLGINNTADKALLKKKLKDLRIAAEREKKKAAHASSNTDAKNSQRNKKKMFSFGKS